MKNHLKIFFYLIVLLFLPTTAFSDAQGSADEVEAVFVETIKPVQDSTRVVTAPTAVGREKGKLGLTVYDLALYDLEYGLAKHLEIGLNIAAPIAFVGFAPHAKVWGRLNSYTTLAFKVSGTFIFPYLKNARDQKWWALGGGPLLTAGSPNTYFNFGVNMSGTNLPIRGPYSSADLPTQSTQDKDKPYWFIIPTIGGVLRVSRKVSLMLQAEMYIVQDTEPVKLLPVSYGLRFHGKHVALDVAFVLPIFKDMWDTMKYFPIGFPLITISKSWPKE